LARKSALSYKAKDNAIIVVDNIAIDEPKTKACVALLDNLKINGKKSLLVLGDSNKNIYLSSRNLEGVEVVTADLLNTYQIMNASSLVITENSLEIIENLLG
jgi:large subunit ribosomal protein L4